MVNTKIIADLPMELGIKRTYKGYFFLIAALELAITDQKNLLYMSKSIFPVIASRYDTTYSCIEPQHPNGDQRLLEFTGSS